MTLLSFKPARAAQKVKSIHSQRLVGDNAGEPLQCDSGIKNHVAGACAYAAIDVIDLGGRFLPPRPHGRRISLARAADFSCKSAACCGCEGLQPSEFAKCSHPYWNQFAQRSLRFSFVLRQSRSSVGRCFLRDSVLCNQHHTEPCFALHHASVSIGSVFERNCLDHRADILQDAEGKGVLGVNRRAGQ
jgi:hypothetical protein